MYTVISFLILGLSLAAPFGPLNAAQLDKGMRRGFFHAWLLGIGGMLADALLMLLIYFGVIHFLTVPFMKMFLWLFGCFVLIYSGIESVVSSSRLIIEHISGNEDTYVKSLLSGFIMSISSPLTLLLWLGIYGSVLVDLAESADRHHVLLYTSAMFTGILIWDMTLAGLASTFRNYLTIKALKVVSIVSGLSLIGFGVHFGTEACIALFR